MKQKSESTHGVSANFAHARREVAKLLPGLATKVFSSFDLSSARAALETLPLTSDEFATAVNRLQNAYRYACAAEVGASRYELHLLGSALRTAHRRLSSL